MKLLFCPNCFTVYVEGATVCCNDRVLLPVAPTEPAAPPEKSAARPFAPFAFSLPELYRADNLVDDPAKDV